MNKIASSLVSVAALTLIGSAANAALIGTITHDYGTGPGQVSTPSLGAGTCDTLNSNSITVTNSSGCQRFFDVFDFSGFAYDSIDSFELTLGFSDTNSLVEQCFLFFCSDVRDDWRVRPASSAINGSASLPAMTRSDSYVEQTFAFDSTLDLFGDIVAGEAFYLWFAQEAGGARSFELFSASLSVFGTPTAAVPAPAPLGLLLGGIALLALRRQVQAG
ncbi:MAG: hypothetical protein JJT85_10610 [Chromatiales bacterium]|nr:hypothetical protein [Chromatiales bacterium]